MVPRAAAAPGRRGRHRVGLRHVKRPSAVPDRAALAEAPGHGVAGGVHGDVRQRAAGRRDGNARGRFGIRGAVRGRYLHLPRGRRGLGRGVGCGPDLGGAVPAARAPRRQQRQHRHGGGTRRPPQPPGRCPVPAPDRDPLPGPHVSIRSPGRPVIRRGRPPARPSVPQLYRSQPMWLRCGPALDAAPGPRRHSSSSPVAGSCAGLASSLPSRSNPHGCRRSLIPPVSRSRRLRLPGLRLPGLRLPGSAPSRQPGPDSQPDGDDHEHTEKYPGPGASDPLRDLRAQEIRKPHVHADPADTGDDRPQREYVELHPKNPGYEGRIVTEATK